MEVFQLSFCGLAAASCSSCATTSTTAIGCGGIRLRGTVGWLSWLLLHLVMLVGFRNRVNVLVNWAWSYLTYDRASRLILDDDRTRTVPDESK